MNINGYGTLNLSAYSTTQTGATSGSSGFESAVAFGSTDSTEGTRSRKMPMPNEAALAKLQETDPALLKKMEEFHQKIDDMRESGASEKDIRTAMKANMDSLSDTEKSELKEVFGQPPGGAGGPGGVGGPGGPGGLMGPAGDDLIASLKNSNSELATKLQGFQDELTSMIENGASPDEVGEKEQSQIDSLSDSDQQVLQDAFKSIMEQHKASRQESESTRSLNSAQLQGLAAYAQSMASSATADVSKLFASLA